MIHRRIGQNRLSAGFTLLEALIVLAIATASVAFAVQVLPKVSERRELEQSAIEFAAVLRGAQLSALQTQRQAVFNFDLKKRRFWSEPDRIYELDPEIDATMTSARSSQAVELGQVRFLPNGQNTGAMIRLKKGKYVVEVTADWLTGDVQVRMLP